MRRRGGLLPAVVALAAIAAGAAAIALDAKPASSAIEAEAAATPVLSARRVPEVVAAPVAERRLVADLRAWLGASPPAACLVVESGGAVVFEHNPTLPLAGASTQKLLTATGLLLALGPDGTVGTRALAAAPPRNGVVAGDLFVVGGGDAALGTPAWRTSAPHETRPRVVHDVDGLVDAVVAAGVTRIEGSVVGDGRRYDRQRYNPLWPQRFIDQDAVGQVGGLMVNDGFALFSPDRSPASTVPAPDPAADAARVVTERLRARGVTVAGEPRAGAAPGGATEVASLTFPVSQIVAEMLTASDNETAEAALKELGVVVSRQGSWAAGTAALTELLTDAGVAMDGVAAVDGSGLSNRGRLSCHTLTDLLTRPETGPVLRDGLAVAGETGTLAGWRSSAAGRLRAKTGSLRNVTALAGEVTPRADSRGGTITFAYVANVPEPGFVDAGEVNLTGLADILAAHPRDLDLAALGPE